VTEGTDAPPPSSPWAHRPPDDDDATPPTIEDPYLLRPLPRARGGVSRLAVSALVAVPIGPVGAILAIVFGWHARRELDQEAAAAGRHALAPLRSGYGLATLAMVLGFTLTMGWGGALSYLMWTSRYRADPAGDEPSAAPPPSTPTAASPLPRPAPRAAETEPFAPKYTQIHRKGGITVVDVGITAPNLAEELAKQRAEASTAHETMLVMTTAGGCDPCRGVDRSLADPLLQNALAGVRLVRLDIDIFHDDLDALKIRHEGIPGFFLLAPDLTPRDGVTGGEWDDDVPVNIAPVLGAFLRGKYAQRREPWRRVPTSGMAL
jgi:hypothetical protein